MSRFDRCPNCAEEMPLGNLHCFACGLDLPPPRVDSGSILIQLYAAISQTTAFEFYRLEAVRLAAAGWTPIAHSWGDDRLGFGTTAALGDSAPSMLQGTLMVTYRQDGRA